MDLHPLRIVAKADVRLDWITDKYSESDVMCAGLSKSEPQQLTIPSILPIVFMANSIKESICEKSEASSVKDEQPSSFEKASNLEESLPAINRFALFFFSILQTTDPIPPYAPITKKQELSNAI